MQVRRRLAGIYIIRGKYVEPQGNIQGKGVECNPLIGDSRGSARIDPIIALYILKLPHCFFLVDVSSWQPG